MEIFQNQMLLNAFESDIIIKIRKNIVTGDKECYGDNDDYIIVNIEIDVVNNKKEKKKIFRLKRDKIAKLEGISVIRIHALTLESMNMSDTKIWLQKKINEIHNI